MWFVLDGMGCLIHKGAHDLISFLTPAFCFRLYNFTEFKHHAAFQELIHSIGYILESVMLCR